MVRQTWTAYKKDDEFIYFKVRNENDGSEMEQRIRLEALPVMFGLGGYPAEVGVLMQMQPLPWQFRKVGDDIYIDEPKNDESDIGG